MTRQIPLTKGWITLVDDEDYDWLNARSWQYQKGYATSDGVAMHRDIMDAPSGFVVDHINGDTLDNRRGNLRVCLHRENLRNQRRSSNNTSGFKGVSKAKKGWRATLDADGQRFEVSGFNSPIQAAIVYDQLARLHHGEFARLNFDASRDWLLIGAVEAERLEVAGKDPPGPA